MAAVKDRLAELKATQSTADEEKKVKGKKKTNVSSMEALQERVRPIEAKLTTIKRNVKEMETMQKNILSSPFCDKKEVYKYEQTVNNIQQVSGEARTLLRELEQETVNDKKAGVDTESAMHRVKTQQLNRLTNTLACQTNDFFKAQADYMDKMKNRMRTQLEVSKGTSNITEEEVNELLNKDNYSAFTQNFISDTKDAQSQLNQIEDRQKDILAMEKSVFEVNQLFKDMSVLVQDQGDALDTIESNIGETQGHVEQGAVQLKQAKVHRTKGRRMKICLAIVIVVVIAIIIIILATQLS